MSKQSKFEMDMNITASDGVIVPVHITMAYPDGYGFYAVKGLQELGQQTGQLYQEMVSRNDLSTLIALAKAQEES